MMTQTSSTGHTSGPSLPGDHGWNNSAERVRTLLQEIRSGFVVHPNFDRVKNSIQDLPLACEELELLMLRFGNSEAAFARGEKDNAVYQLNVVLRDVCRDRTTDP